MGVASDLEQSLSWWRRAAVGGLAVAQNAVGAAYLNGEGVAFDPIESYAWFLVAANQGLAVATANLELARSRLSVEQEESAHLRFEAVRSMLDGHEDQN